MKKLLLFLPLLTGCASVRYAQTDHGQIVDEHKQSLSILGNPRMTCVDSKGKVIADGYFVYQQDDGAFIIDEFGKQYLTVENPVCQLGNNGRPQH